MFGKLRYYIKRLLCWLGIPFTEICQRCGSQVEIVWRADDRLWEAAVKNQYNVLCPRCFSKLVHRYVVYFRANLEPFNDKR